MKTIFCFLAIICAMATHAQNCKNYYFLQSNKTVEISITDKKGNPSGKQVYAVSNTKTTGNTTTATINSEFFDKKGKSSAKSTNEIKCSGGVLMMDMKMSLPQQSVEQYNIGEAKADNIYIEYPSVMNAGDQLKDGSLQLEMDTKGMKQTLTYNVTERKVDGKESVTTSAGTWDCYKITFKAKMSVKTMGISIPFNLDGTEWYAPGFGVVKTQSKWGGTEVTSIK